MDTKFQKFQLVIGSKRTVIEQLLNLRHKLHGNIIVADD